MRKENKIIRKSNELVEARYKFSIWSMRVLLKVISVIQPDDEDFKTYDVYVGDLIRDYNLQSFGDAYQLLKVGAEDMVGKTMEIPVLVDGIVEFGKVTMISSAIPKMDERKNRYIQVRFDPEIKPHLLKLKSKFLQYDIRNVLKLQSVHSVRIYELLKQYEKIGKRRFDVQDLKDTLGLYDDDGKPQYPLYANFKQRVVDKAQKDLAKHTDISFTYEEIKQGRAVKELLFHIFPNKSSEGTEEAEVVQAIKNAVPKPEADARTTALEQLAVQGWGVSLAVFRDLLKQYGIERVERAAEVTKRAKRTNKVRDSIAGYFVDAVKKEYADEQVRADNKKQRLREDREKRLRDLENQLQTTEDAQSQAVHEHVRRLVEHDESIREAAIERVKSEMKGYIKLKFGEPIKMDTDDFRKDPVLRAAVINAIVEINRSEFQPVEAGFSGKINALKREIAQIKNGA